MSCQATVLRINQAMRFFLYVLIFWLPYSNAVVESSVVICLFLWAIKRSIVFIFQDAATSAQGGGVKEFIQAFQPRSSILTAPIGFFLLACTFSVAGSVFPGQSFYGLITKTLEWFVIYFLVIETIVSKRQIFIAIAIFIFTSLATSLDGLIQVYITYKDFFGGRVIVPHNGATAAFVTYNDLGGYLTVVIPLTLSLFFLVRNRSAKILTFFIFTICAWCLVVTFARGAWLAGSLGILFFLFFNSRKLFAIASIALIAFVLCFSFLASPEVKKGFRIDTSNMGWRLEVWQYGMKMVQERPVFGYGPNSFMKIFKEHRRHKGRQADYEPTYAHNCYVQMAVETGIVGLALFSWILVRMFRKIIRQIKEPHLGAGDLRMLLAGLLAALFGFLAHSFVDTNFYSLKLSALYWFMTGLAISTSRALDQKT